MPALPLHEAGKYVAAAYLVVFTIVLIYVAIMAAKLSRIEREVESINELLDQSGQMSAGLLALGISHKTASVAVREKLALPEGRAVTVLTELVAHPAIHEAVAISTCNRTELYLVATDAVEAENEALSALSRQAGIPPTELLGSLYSLRGMDAVRHLFSVAGGLDSMIVGEAEIQGQVKRAYELALVEGVTGPITNRLFRDALGAGKRARTETASAARACRCRRWPSSWRAASSASSARGGCS